MTPTRQGSLHLFRVFGIDVYLHWSWFIIAIIEINARRGHYSSPSWNALEYVALFAVVLLHEMGHALACRQVGGQANQIVLWPLGGVAYVSPPPRPGATLWSIAAGPLVNAILLPIFWSCVLFGRQLGWDHSLPNFYTFLRAMVLLNAVLLVFNLLPIYPLDGGQILGSLLWFVIGRSRSLMVVSILGMIGVVGLFALALAQRSPLMGVMSAFILMNCWTGLRHARTLARLASLPRHAGLACPECGAAPPAGDFWPCPQCHVRFDPFAAGAVCPRCQTLSTTTFCFECGRRTPLETWIPARPVPGAGPPPLA